MTRKRPDVSRESSLSVDYALMTAALTLLVSRALRGVEPSRWTRDRAVQIDRDVKKMVKRYRGK